MDFYRNALTYLTYANLETIPAAEQMTLAFDLGIAALIGESIYNFGELVSTRVVLLVLIKRSLVMISPNHSKVDQQSG